MTKLVASMIVHNEIGRYLDPCLDHLLEFVDEIRILDDHSTDGTLQTLLRYAETDERFRVTSSQEAPMFENEGRARNALLDWTLEGEPSHILAIDADEFVTDGLRLRELIDDSRQGEAFLLGMQEVWKIGDDGPDGFPTTLGIRVDGQWGSRRLAYLWKIPPIRSRHARYRIKDAKLASGRVPAYAGATRRRVETGVDILHFGWTNPWDRAARFARYEKHDGGRYHRSSHLESIMWGDDQVVLSDYPIPVGLDAKTIDEIVERARQKPVPRHAISTSYDALGDRLVIRLYEPLLDDLEQRTGLESAQGLAIEEWVATDGRLAEVHVLGLGSIGKREEAMGS